MTGYQSKKKAAQDKITDEQGRPMTYWGGEAQPPAISIWRQPVYQPPKMDTPRPGASDHLKVRSRGI